MSNSETNMMVKSNDFVYVRIDLEGTDGPLIFYKDHILQFQIEVPSATYTYSYDYSNITQDEFVELFDKGNFVTIVSRNSFDENLDTARVMFKTDSVKLVSFAVQ